MNKYWKESDTGYLELWNNDMTKCVEKIEPLFNRVILFECTKTSYHGVPEVNENRKSFTQVIFISIICGYHECFEWYIYV